MRNNLAGIIVQPSSGAIVILIAAPFASWTNPLSAQNAVNLLTQLQFKNSGTVTPDMKFRYFHQPDDYLETADLWSIYSDGTYLYQVDGRAWWSDDGSSPNTLLTDTLYGQLWASVLNLDALGNKEQLISHLTQEENFNGSPFGLRVLGDTGHRIRDVGNPAGPWQPNQPKPNDDLIWPGGSLDWSALKIYLGGRVDESLAEASQVISNQRTMLNDQWDYTDLNNNWNGEPWANSHYTRQLILWALPLAISETAMECSDQASEVQPGGFRPTPSAVLYPAGNWSG